MDWNDIKNCINEWIWDNDERTYFWILNADDETKSIKVRGIAGLETDVFYAPNRFYKDLKKVGVGK